MKKIFAELLPGVPYVPLLYPNLGVQERDQILFLNNAFRNISEPFMEVVERPEDADYILLPHNYPALRHHADYVKRQADLAQKLDKKLLVFWHGDLDEEVPFGNTLVFRTSQYRSNVRPNEVVMPAYAEDLLGDDRLSLRQKHDGKPVVGFCGWAQYKNFKNRIGTLVKNVLAFGGPRRKGLSFRMDAINKLKKSDLVEPNLIIRGSYSGHSDTIRGDPDQWRREYKQNLLGSDYALVIKGDGNYSYRFYEAMSLGRIPVLLDTECVLPLEDIIDYSSCVLRVDYKDLGKLDQIVADHYTSVSPDGFMSMQKRAREVFEKYLRIDRFLQYAADNIL